MTELNPAFEALLANQLEMNPQTWAALVERGVDDQTPIVIDFAFTAKTKPDALSLEAFLREKTTFSAVARAERGVALRKRWIVRGRTQPSVSSLAMLDDWVTFMVRAGYKHACRFDGWGAQVPEPAAEPDPPTAAEAVAAAESQKPRTNGTVGALAAERQGERGDD